MEEKITMAHGAGGRFSRQLINDVMLPAFDNDTLNEMNDGAVLGGKLVFTTDSFVVRPLFFAGGDIGRLAVSGTVNDLAMMGAMPNYLSAAMIIEEGFDITELRKIVWSMAVAADEAGVKIVTGDTKVVGHGQCDGIFINTAGIGLRLPNVNISIKNVKPGLKILINGMIGDHATAIIAERHALTLPDSFKSDCAPLNSLVKAMLEVEPKIAMMRDPTRGGLASTLNEIAQDADVGIMIDEKKLPIRTEVRGVCKLLGFDVLELANEGKVLAFVPAEAAEAVLDAMKKHPLGKQAAIIGEVVDNPRGKVGIRTAIGSKRFVDMPVGALVPRIC